MTFVSYAQNFEDVMLWRALKHLASGFYIDVGAAWPDEHSVTKHFYNKGWHGLNIEPNPNLHLLYAHVRPRDTNLLLALSDASGEADMYFVADTGLSSLSKSVTENYGNLGWSVRTDKVLVQTLQQVCERYAAGCEIHFLKVDVEGLEERVLRGNDWSRFRPWIVLVEATIPMSQIESYAASELVLTAADYHFAYADGLNRFYVAAEHRDIAPVLKYPPNIFDGFVSSSESSAILQTQEAEKRAQEAEVRANRAEVRAHSAELRRDEAEARADERVRQTVARGEQMHGLGLTAKTTKPASAPVASQQNTAKRFNRILDDAARVEYAAMISALCQVAPHEMQRLSQNSRVRDAFVIDAVTEFALRCPTPKLLSVQTTASCAAAALRAEGVAVDFADPIMDVELDDYFDSLFDMPNAIQARYDVVFATSVIEHVKHDERFVSQIGDLLKAGGVAVLTCPFDDAYKPGDTLPDLSYRMYTQFDLSERLLRAVPDCELVDSPDWRYPVKVPPAHLSNSMFATFVIRKRANLQF